MFDMIAAGLYSLASMLVGEGEDSVRLVETAVATAEVSVCQNPDAGAPEQPAGAVHRGLGSHRAAQSRLPCLARGPEGGGHLH